MVLEARALNEANIKVSAGPVPTGGHGGESIPYLFQLLVAAGIPWLVAASLQSPLPLSHFLPLICAKSPSAFLHCDHT